VRFWLGTHEVSWLGLVTVPLFISHRRLARQKALPVARGPWALDSGGYSELGLHGRWLTEEAAYVDAVAHYEAVIGGLAWATPQDWMCEPKVLERTGLSVREHQERTVASYLSLRDQGPFVPVLQGQTLPDYEVCMDLYAQAGVDLYAAPLIGLGTVCRRHRTPEISALVHELAGAGLRLHGFGMKSAGVARVAHALTSADSMAWSTRGRYEWQHEQRRLCGGEHRGGCSNCRTWALQWREKVIDGCGLWASLEDR
jgi:hypothetical protein